MDFVQTEKKSFYELSEEEQDEILKDSVSPAESAMDRDLIEVRPSKLIDPDNPKTQKKPKGPKTMNPASKKDAEEIITSSPFQWTKDQGFIIPPGEDEAFLSGKLTQEQLEVIKAKSQKMKPVGGTANQFAAALLEGDVETISTDSVDDRFDNI